MNISDLKIDIYADGANVSDMVFALKSGTVKGFTTNPSLMKLAGVKNYLNFAKKSLSVVEGAPISFEVFSDDFSVMEKEALKLSSLGRNVFVKIPITNTKGESSVPLIKKLSSKGVNINVTAIFTLKQLRGVLTAFSERTNNIVSVFAGRVADIGIDPIPLMKKCVDLTSKYENVKLLWASCREVFNIVEADRLDVDIITCTDSVIKKLNLFGMNSEKRSLQTVQGFNRDVKHLGFSILDNN
ncbi:MAG: transaldolase [Liquorilactobacillus nagelii]|uniref:transaldolase n=1 Tax=Liquorilactobacillus nagelii TaxID=82688 RepID=UPI0039E773DE